MMIVYKTLEDVGGYDPFQNHFVLGSYLDSGTIIMQIMVLLVNLKIISSTNTHTCCSICVQFMSILFLYAMFFALSLP